MLIRMGMLPSRFVTEEEPSRSHMAWPPHAWVTEKEPPGSLVTRECGKVHLGGLVNEELPPWSPMLEVARRPCVTENMLF